MRRHLMRAAASEQETGHDDRYKWVALANTTASMFMATLDGSIVIIALPAIFRGIHLDPLAAGNISYLLWMIMGYRLVQAVLVVTVGRLGDMFGRVRIYNAGFVVFTIPASQRGFALGTNQIAGLAGMFVGLVAGGLLAAFAILETKIAEPMFQLSLFRIRAFTVGNLAGLAVAVARGGLQFMLIIWLQGIWLPLHGYDYSQTPLWAGIFLLPLTAGFLVSGPVAGWMSDKFGSRGIATAGMVVFGGSLVGLMLLPVSFPYPAFALLIALNGIGSGMFAAPNSSSIMGSVPARQRGAASGMRSTFQNSGTALSVGLFFSVMIAGLASRLPQTLSSGLRQHGVAAGVAHQIASLPPVSSLFASVLGVNPLGHLLAAQGALATLPAAARQTLTGREFFPGLISGPFQHGLIVVFAFAAVLSALAALASALRGTGSAGTTPGNATSGNVSPGNASSDANPGGATITACGRRNHGRRLGTAADGVFAGTDPGAPGAGIASGMRQLPADLPDDPAPGQVNAWIELAELVNDQDFRQRARSMALAGQHDTTASGQARAASAGEEASAGEHASPAGATSQPDYQAVIQHAGQAATQGIAPGSAEGQAVLDRIVTSGPPAAQRSAILRQLETFTDARVERYWQLLAILNGQPAPPSVVPAFEWLIAALRAGLDGRPSEASQGQREASQG